MRAVSQLARRYRVRTSLPVIFLLNQTNLAHAL